MRFLLVRFAQGSGGKFLSSVLQTSRVVDHWCATLQSHKSSVLWQPMVEEYTRRSFTADRGSILHFEPHAPYNSDLYSTSRERGNDVTLAQYLAHAKHHKDHRTFVCQAQSLICNLVFHRIDLPLFCRNSPAVTIMVTSPREQKWLDQTLWHKHWIEIGQEICHMPDDPEFCNITRLPAVLQYRNQSRWPKTHKSQLIHDMVRNNATRKGFLDTSHVTAFDHQNGINNYPMDLACFFDTSDFVSHIDRIFEHFGLGRPCHDLVSNMHRSWLAKQIDF